LFFTSHRRIAIELLNLFSTYIGLFINVVITIAAVTLDIMMDSLKQLPCPCDVCPGGKRGGYSVGIAIIPMIKLKAEYDG
jgi:hypothetical protein